MQNELKQLMTQLETIIYKKSQILTQQLRYEYQQYSNKSSKYLANLSQHKKEKALIPSIRDSTGNITQNQQEINNVFHEFYSNLYFSDYKPCQAETDALLNNLNLPKLTKAQANILDAPIII